MSNHATAREVNFDCLVGPTHHFGGLSLGNLASSKNKARLSSPKQAALQGLKKMSFLAQRGFSQAVLPPHPRPYFTRLKTLGFLGEPEQIMRQVYEYKPQLFYSLCSSSFMWAANAATISPNLDCLDKKTHITPSNLNTMFHRSIEQDFASQVFNKIFNNKNLFMVHPPLPSHDMYSDEGAANHNRLSPSHDHQGLEIFVYGKESLLSTQKSSCFPARQSKMANEALARLHRLENKYFLNIEQNPDAIDSGAFHNDVVCVSNENVFLLHEKAFLDQASNLQKISETYKNIFGQAPIILEIKEQDLSLEDAVSSYLFNSQLLSKPTGNMLLFAPKECQTNIKAYKVIQKLISQNNPIDEVAFFDVCESMANGGGPACLRLRVLLNNQEFLSLSPDIIFTEKLFFHLQSIIEEYYLDELHIENFFEQKFFENNKKALTEISSALGLHGIYEGELSSQS